MLAFLAGAALATQFHVVVASLPARPFIEQRGGEQILNFDLLLHNDGQEPLRLAAIREQIFDKSGQLQAQREINANGKPSALMGLGDATTEPGEIRDIYQPFDRHDGGIELDRIHLTLIFLKLNAPVPPVAFTGDYVATLDLHPIPFNHTAAYCLPLTGRLLVHDGHDLNSHHRRQNLTARFNRDPKTAANPNLYAYDFVRIDETGALFKGDPDRKENWFTFGAPVYAPVDGVVARVVDGVPDNSFAGTEPVIPSAAQKLDPDGFGNYVALRAADGRVSWLLHMEAGSLLVHTGQEIKAGEPLGRIGFSGDALFPHEHFTVTETAAYSSQGVPSYFSGFTRRGEGRGAAVDYGQIDTGDIVERGPDCRH